MDNTVQVLWKTTWDWESESESESESEHSSATISWYVHRYVCLYLDNWL